MLVVLPHIMYVIYRIAPQNICEISNGSLLLNPNFVQDMSD